MPVTDFLDRNARMYPNEVALVELNPEGHPADYLERIRFDSA